MASHQRHAGGRAQLRHAARAARSARPTGSPTGASPPTRSTTGASSTSTTWRRCAWRTRRCSRRRTAWCWSWRPAARCDGLRIDHPDGLYDPAQYFQRLQERIAALTRRRAARSDAGRALPIYLVVEKITAAHERVPETGRCTAPPATASPTSSTACSSTPRRAAASTASTASFTGEVGDFDDVVVRIQARDPAQRAVQRAERAGQPARAHRPGRPAHARLHAEHAAPGADRGDRLLSRSTAPTSPSASRRRIGATSTGRSRAPSGAARRPTSASSISSSRALLDRPVAGQRPGSGAAGAQRSRMKFQQLTAPVTAKGVEDTAFYRYNRLVSLNEVGGDPERFGFTLAAFHGASLDRAQALAAHDARHLHPRQQALGGRARAHQHAVRDAGRVAAERCAAGAG